MSTPNKPALPPLCLREIYTIIGQIKKRRTQRCVRLLGSLMPPLRYCQCSGPSLYVKTGTSLVGIFVVAVKLGDGWVLSLQAADEAGKRTLLRLRHGVLGVSVTVQPTYIADAHRVCVMARAVGSNPF